MLGQIDRYGLGDSAFAFFTILGISTLPKVRKLFVWADGRMGGWYGWIVDELDGWMVGWDGWMYCGMSWIDG
jgi:hypothetical protein